MWSYQSMAHGADSLMYFRYRGATKGAEQFCYGVIDADNVKRRKFYEVQSFFRDMKKYERGGDRVRLRFPGIVPYPAPEHSARSGGTVIVTYRHAVKDADNNVPFGETLPVHYNALAGLTVEETESLQDYDAFPVVGSGVFEGVEGTGGIFCDIGLVELELIPGTRNKKRILLTAALREETEKL